MPEESTRPIAHVPDGDRLDSWKQIAHYLNRTVRTVQRWEAEESLPVHRRVHGPSNRHPVHAYKSELDGWFLRESASPGLSPAPKDGAPGRRPGPRETISRRGRDWRSRNILLTLAAAAILFICVFGIAAWVFSTGALAGSNVGIVR